MNRLVKNTFRLACLIFILSSGFIEVNAQGFDNAHEMVKEENKMVFNRINDLTIMQKNKLSKINLDFASNYIDCTKQKSRSTLPLAKQIKNLEKKRETEAKKILSDKQFNTYLILLQENKMRRANGQ